MAFGMIAMLEAATRTPSTVTAEALIETYRMTPDDAEALRSVALHGIGRDWPPDAAASTTTSSPTWSPPTTDAAVHCCRPSPTPNPTP